MNHNPYRDVIHDSKTDESVCQLSELAADFVAASVEDGDEVEIIVKKTGRRPFSDKKIKLVAPHTYA